MLKQLVNQCSVSLRLEALEPMLVKSGSAVVNGPDMAFVRTSRHNRFEPFLPGSSLKGVLRSHAERIARTLKERSVCDVFKDARVEGCSSRFTSAKNHDDYRASCPACRLFGSLHWKGRFSVSDAYLTPEHQDAEPELRDGIGIDRITGGVAGGAKFDMEVLPAGVRFSARIDVVNFELWQLGWLAYVLRDLADGQISVGSGTARGLGRLSAVVEKLALDYVGTPAMLETKIPGLGALASEADRARYGLASDDFAERPERFAFIRPRGSLRTGFTSAHHDEAFDLLAHVAPAWDHFIARQPAISA